AAMGAFARVTTPGQDPPMVCGRVSGVIALSALLTSGCATLPDGHVWGGDATWRPAGSQLRAAATHAFRDPWVWVPALGAAVMQIDDWDRRVSDWAREHTPVFRSEANAERWSDDLRTASVIAHYATIIATPGGSDAGDWLIAKAKG